ncbi:MAG: diacylglycerol kinase family protein [Verrucomicrobiota bacterium]
MSAILILNHAAGSVNGDRDAVLPEEVVAAFAEAGITVTLRASAPDQLRATLAAAVAARPSAIFVGGGDGTISTAAGVLAGTGIPLGVLPLGTLNHFARDLGLPIDWKEAVAALAVAPTRAVDLGEVNGRIFVNNCSLGSYPEAVRHREKLRHEHGRGKWLAMALATFAVFRRLRRLRVRIDMPNTTFTLRTPFVFVGNNCYTGHVFDHSLRCCLDDGQLSIYTTSARRHFTLLRLVWQTLFRRIDAADALDVRTTREAIITNLTSRPLPIAVDGELVQLQAPLRFRIRPGALHVFAPAPSPTPAPALADGAGATQPR